MPDSLPPAEWPAWLADVAGLADELRAAGVPVGVGDELRMRVLIGRLKTGRVAIGGAEAVTRWLSPILCRNSDHHNALAAALRSLELAHRAAQRRSSLGLGRAETVEAHSGEEKAVATRTAGNRRQVLTWVGFAAILAIGLSAWFMLDPLTKPIDTSPPEQTCTPPGCPTPGTEAGKGRKWRWWSVELGLLPLMAALTFVMISRRRRAFLLRGLVPRDAPRVKLDLPIGNDVIFRADRMRAPAADWRRYRWESSDRFDPVASIEQTVRAGGLPTIVNGRHRVVAKYIILVDRAGANDMLAQMAGELVARLQNEQVEAARFDYRGDPRRLVPVHQPELEKGMTLDELTQSKGESHQLIIFADAASAFDRTTHRPRAWVQPLLEWFEPIWMSPLPRSKQGADEWRLQESGIEVVEASSDGVAAIGRMLRRGNHLGSQPALPNLPSELDFMLATDVYRWTSDQAPSGGEIAALLSGLQEGLKPDAFVLLVAVAVFPMTHPRLTLYAAERLGAVQGWTDSLETVTGAVGRLPWLRKGSMPEWLRLALVEWLERGENRKLASTIRTLWLQFLEGPPASAAPTGARDAGSEQRTLGFEFVRANSSAIAERHVEKARQNASAFEERILLAFLTQTPVSQVVFEAPADWRDLTSSRWKVSEAVAIGIAVVAALAIAVWSETLKQLMLPAFKYYLDSLDDTLLYAIIGTNCLAAPLIFGGSYLRQLGRRWSRFYNSAPMALFALLLAVPTIMLIVSAEIERDGSNIGRNRESFLVATPFLAYIVLWLNFGGSIGLRDGPLLIALVRRWLAVCICASVVFVVAFALATAIVQTFPSPRTLPATSFLPDSSTGFSYWRHVLLLMILAGSLSATILRLVDVSLSKSALAAVACFHVFGALSIAHAVSTFLNILSKPSEWEIAGWMIFVFTAAAFTPLAVAKWREIDRRTVLHVYAFAALAITLELAKVVVPAYTLSDRTLARSIWFLPVLVPAFLALQWVHTDFRTTALNHARMLALTCVLMAAAAGAFWVTGALGNASPLLIFMAPCAIALDAATLALVMCWHFGSTLQAVSFGVASRKPPSEFARQLLWTAWPLWAALLLFFAAIFSGVMVDGNAPVTTPPRPEASPSPPTQGTTGVPPTQQRPANDTTPRQAAPEKATTPSPPADPKSSSPPYESGPLGGAPLQGTDPLQGSGPLQGGGPTEKGNIGGESPSIGIPRSGPIQGPAPGTIAPRQTSPAAK